MPYITSEKDILCHILQCRYADIDDLCKLFDSFDVELKDITNWNHINSVIEDIFRTAIFKSGINEQTHEISTYTNFQDSHLYIDGEEVYTIDDIKLIVINDEQEEEIN